MKVKNITTRIISIGSIFIEPGCEANIDDSFSQFLNKDYFEFLEEKEKINEESKNPKRIGLNQKNKDLNKNTESEDDKP